MSSPMAVPVRTMHRVVGAATIAAFIVTGVYLAGSMMLLIAPLILVLAFISEPGPASPQRPLTSAGVMLLVLGILCHVPARK